MYMYFLHIKKSLYFMQNSQVALVVKNSPVNAGDMRGRLDPWVGKIPWSKKRLPTAVFLHGIVDGQRSLAGYSLWGHRVRDD